MIINPWGALNQPFRFSRENPVDYSLVERKTIAMVGKEDLRGWTIIATRDKVVPKRTSSRGDEDERA